MSLEISWYVQLLDNKALLIQEQDSEDTTAFASSANDKITYHLVDVVDLIKYKSLRESPSENYWKSARVVDKSYKFEEITSGGWCSYTYQTEGCGETIRKMVHDFTKHPKVIEFDKLAIPN